MKKRTLNQTWTLCLWMWRSIAKNWNKRKSVDCQKKLWLKQNGFGKTKILADCFFCDFVGNKSFCPTCPGKLVDSRFSCTRESYNYQLKPVEFYAELLRLNRIRKEKKCKNTKSKSKKR